MDYPMIQQLGSICNVLLTDEAHTDGLHWRRNEETEPQVDTLDGEDIAGRMVVADWRRLRIPRVRATTCFTS